jgi:hypothetical protein
MLKHLILISLILQTNWSMSAQNYDESKVPSYTLPELLVDATGSQIQSVAEWQNRRGKILNLFEEQMYGRVPEFDYHTTHSTKTLVAPELAGKATQEEVTITLENQYGQVNINMLLTLPKNRAGKVPVFLGLNFQGNQATNPNPEITLTTNYVIGGDQLGIQDSKATEESRGARVSRWPLELILSKGYGLATIHCGDIDPDFDDGFKNGVHSLLPEGPAVNQWGTVAAWAWGLSRALDYLVYDGRVDGNKVAVIGHSRLGKAALWAGALDQRFALVISNDSGCGGAALSRRQIGETVEAINTRFPHWFCKNFHQYNQHEDKLPVDQHMLLALIAPRPVYVASATEDQWADPRGEYTSLYLAGPAFKLFGFETLDQDQLPAADIPISADRQAYHLRTGKHDITSYDWQQYLDFADQIGLRK